MKNLKRVSIELVDKLPYGSTIRYRKRLYTVAGQVAGIITDCDGNWLYVHELSSRWHWKSVELVFIPYNN
jgi:hypothetical protein